MHNRFSIKKPIWGVLLLYVSVVAGCAAFDPKPAGTPVFRDQPKEGAMSSLPHYFLTSPDIISIEAIHLVPRAPYLLRSMDVIYLDIVGTLPDEPSLSNHYTIDPGGFIQLGVNYGSVRIGGLSMDQAEREIEQHLRRRLQNPRVFGRVVQMSEIQQITGNKLIEPCGHITLGSYGRVYIQGLTIPEAKEAIEMHLTKALEMPVVAVEVFAFNSKEYYVILQGGGMGDIVFSFPYMGNETVLKAMANVSGMRPFSSKRMWVARPIGNSNKRIIMPVDWNDIVAYGGSDTNYQLLPGDRVFIAEDKMVRTDNFLAKTLAPFERLMGFAMLGAGTATRLSGDVLRGGGDRRGGGGF